MSRAPVAWVFNLDAEDELTRAGPHTPNKPTQRRIEGLLPTLAQLMQPQDEVVWPGAQKRTFTAQWGRAWCPTRWACEQLQKAGLRVPPAPPAAVLRLVNHRRFAHALGQALPGARFVQTQAELRETLADARLLKTLSTEGNWLMKRPLGYAGRGRRKIAPGGLNATDRTWIDAALRTGDGLQVEPLVVRELDCALHGWLSADGALTLGHPTVSDIDASGAWVSTRRESNALSAREREALQTEARATAAALTKVGFFGPFGLDGFRWRDPGGALHFQPRCELNARYSMGWATGMAEFNQQKEY